MVSVYIEGVIVIVYQVALLRAVIGLNEFKALNFFQLVCGVIFLSNSLGLMVQCFLGFD